MTQEVRGAIDNRELRHAFGTFTTVVTVVTTRTVDGVPRHDHRLHRGIA
ncbi:hypothetical protein [Arthrobacter sp. PAMC25564]|nr:hypothetical protein [Arthrobacter sp. PAMC25564]